MSDKKRIDIGDEVRVIFDTHNFGGKVLRVAEAAGDWWVIDSEREGLCYVQTFAYIMLVNKAESEKDCPF